MKTSILLILIIPIFAMAETSQDLEQAAQTTINGLNKMKSQLLTLPDCLYNPNDPKSQKCAEITDDFCAELWNKTNEGNLKTFDGLLKAGTSEKSGLKLSAIENDKALINSVPNMPPDMQEIFTPIIKRLQEVLGRESKSTKWHREYSQTKQALKDAAEDLADKRFDLKYAPAKAENFLKWTTEQNLDYQKETRNIRTQMTIAKYAKDPNWLRVEKVFPEVKKDLLTIIDKMNIPESHKEKLKNRISSVELSLPVKNPETVMADEDCSETEVNAFYTSYTNHFTVCAGMFNSYQSEAVLIRTIGHELAHSIDSNTYSEVEWSNNSVISQKLALLKNSNKQTYKCDEWKKITNVINAPAETFKAKSDPMDGLFNCLRGKGELEELNLENVKKASRQMIKKRIANFADFKMFSSQVDKKAFKDNAIIENDSYFRPDVANAKDYQYVETNQVRDVKPNEVFMQNLYCIMESKKLTKTTFESSDSKIREEIFNGAIEQTSRILENAKVDYLQYCGQNCSDLAEFDLSIDTSEKVADWFSNSIFPLYLNRLPPADRKEAAALRSSRFCPEREITSEFSKIEKKYSLKPHPEDRMRRISSFTPEVAKIINCELDESDLGDSKCSP